MIPTVIKRVLNTGIVLFNNIEENIMKTKNASYDPLEFGKVYGKLLVIRKCDDSPLTVPVYECECTKCKEHHNISKKAIQFNQFKGCSCYK